MHIESLPVLEALAGVIQDCAAQREHRMGFDDLFQRDLHAESAGRELLMSWLRPSSVQDPIGSELRRLVKLFQTLLNASVAENQLAPEVTIACRHVELPESASRVLFDLSMLLLISAWSDGATDISITLELDEDHVILRVESDRAGIVAMPPVHPRVIAIARSLERVRGSWEGAQTGHGSWLIDVRVPANVAQEHC